MNAFTIRDLENISGIKAHTIRVWEQRYDFLKPQRTDTNIRYYSSEELKTILNVSLLNKYGFKISSISKMNSQQMQDKIQSLTHSSIVKERIVNELIQQLLDLDMNHFEQLLNGYIHSKGIEHTITQIIFPFLERIGVLWLTNHINPAQEHLVTNIIRQKLISGIESMHVRIKSGQKGLLFLPEGEHHELGLLFVYYLLKSKGVDVLYVGANAPLKDVEYIVRLKKPNFLYTHLTSVSDKFNFEKFMQQLQQRCGDYKVVISGPLTHTYKKQVPNNIWFKKSLGEAMEFVGAL
jgi:DNA-binding transcriptional MerR regulator